MDFSMTSSMIQVLLSLVFQDFSISECIHKKSDSHKEKEQKLRDENILSSTILLSFLMEKCRLATKSRFQGMYRCLMTTYGSCYHVWLDTSILLSLLSKGPLLASSHLSHTPHPTPSPGPSPRQHSLPTASLAWSTHCLWSDSLLLAQCDQTVGSGNNRKAETHWFKKKKILLEYD